MLVNFKFIIAQSFLFKKKKIFMVYYITADVKQVVIAHADSDIHFLTVF